MCLKLGQHCVLKVTLSGLYAHLVKGKHLSGHLTAIEECNSHPVVDLKSCQYRACSPWKELELVIFRAEVGART